MKDAQGAHAPLAIELMEQDGRKHTDIVMIL